MLFGICHLEHDIVEISTLNSGAGFGRRGEIPRYGGIGSKQVVVVGTTIVRILLLLLKDADYGIGDALDQQVCPERRLSRKQLTVGFRAENDHAAAFALIVSGNQAAFGDQQRPEILVGRPHADHAPIGRIVLAYFGNCAPQLRAHIFYQIALIANQKGVIHIELNFAPGSSASDLRTGAPAPQDDEILAKGLHVFLLIDAEAAPQAHEQNYRGDPPHDSEHRKESAHLVSSECGERLAQDFGESHGEPAFGLWLSGFGCGHSSKLKAEAPEPKPEACLTAARPDRLLSTRLALPSSRRWRSRY